ncbi:hypothetical protein LPJ76_003522 [Coemansia sp. RSA 638]|nr:hypothetical protein LPJ76_003522 [Coemansia sp. RSA 638]
MPRSVLNNTVIPLLRQLTKKLGEQQAKNELRWMTDHVRKAITTKHTVEHTTNARLWRDQRAPSAEETELASKRFSSVQWSWLRQAVHDRVETNKPLQYILGTQPFGNATVLTRPPVLIPRWETEEWMLKLADMIRAENTGLLNVLDACTGSGCVALGLACALPRGSVHITGVDISQDACELALENLARNKAKQAVEFQCVDLHKQSVASELMSRRVWDMVVANPPYVTPAEYAELDPDVKDWEDVRALVPGDPTSDPDQSGLSFVVRLAQLARELGLADGESTKLPRLVVEIGGAHQVDGARQAMHDNGFNLTEVWKDMAGIDRVVLGYHKT